MVAGPTISMLWCGGHCGFRGGRAALGCSVGLRGHVVEASRPLNAGAEGSLQGRALGGGKEDRHPQQQR